MWTSVQTPFINTSRFLKQNAEIRMAYCPPEVAPTGVPIYTEHARLMLPSLRSMQEDYRYLSVYFWFPGV